MRTAVLEPLSAISGFGAKLWGMILADLLLAGDLDRERWDATGASMITIDSLVHNWLHRTGILRRFGAEHPYGPACYGPDGCATLIKSLAGHVDARAFNPAFPTHFPRFVQSAIWNFYAADGENVCNGNRIDDRQRCRNETCAAFDRCDRIRLHG